jgi:pyridoxamine 5'-phosphate oxidase
VSNPYLAARLPDQLPNDPMHWIQAWLTEAEEQAVRRNANAMAIVTCGHDARPAARMVLCKDFQPGPGYLVFYTNYKSDKARQIQENPNVAVLFHWDQLGRQARIEGQAVRSPDAESDAYFATRDWGSQIGAWGSDQSAPLESRNALLAQVSKRALKLGVNVARNLGAIISSDHAAIPRPPHWGGFRVWASQVELWIEGKDRIHDRARWQRTLQRQDGNSFVVGEWCGKRLQP